MRFVERAEVGMLHVNQPTVGGEAQLPFGGIKATGVGETPSRTGDPCLARPSHGQKVMVGIRTYCTPLTDCRVRVGHGVPDDARCSPIV